jgi:hypothetical protein
LKAGTAFQPVPGYVSGVFQGLLLGTFQGVPGNAAEKAPELPRHFMEAHAIELPAKTLRSQKLFSELEGVYQISFIT